MIRRLLAAALPLAVSVVLIGAVGPAGAEGYAPLDRPGPKLSVPAATLRAALKCSGDLAGSPLEPVLLNPATGVTGAQNFSWTYEPYFTKEGRPWCELTMPFQTLGDIQVAGEYLVHAIRYMHAKAGRRIAILGHSQGGMSMRWALRFWPDTRKMVADVIGMAPDNHGTTLVNGICVEGRTTCAPHAWQQASTSAFIKALNSRMETFSGISYTSIYTRTDEVVIPTGGPRPTSALFNGNGRIRNVKTQSICPLDVYEHLAVGTVDPVTHALVMDALKHDGPANPSRINRSVCFKLLMPGVSPFNAAANLSLLGGLPHVLLVPVPFINLAGAPQLAAETRLRCYTRLSGCP